MYTFNDRNLALFIVLVQFEVYTCITSAWAVSNRQGLKKSLVRSYLQVPSENFNDFQCKLTLSPYMQIIVLM